MENEEEVVIKAENVYKNFILPHERTGSVKGVFTSMFSKATKKKEIQHALKDISLEIKKGEFFGIVGRNGSGKSTLLKILANIYQPTKGQITTKGKLVPFIELGVGFNPELSGRDNIYLNGAVLGFSKKEVAAMYDDIVSFAELERFMDQKLKNYSSGMQVRLAFSMAIKAEADILLVDEVLAVGDTAFQQKSLKYFYTLKRNKKTVVFVSHDMESIEQFCDRAVMIDKSRIIFSGTAREAANKYRQLFSDEAKAKKDDQTEEHKRWGDQKAHFSNFELKQTDETIIIKTTIDFEGSLNNVVCGFSILGNAQRIVGTNTYLEGVNLQDYVKNKKQISIQWLIPNIFADGEYTISLGINTPSLGLTHDWIEDALGFDVLKNTTTGHVVEPKVEIKVEGA